MPNRKHVPKRETRSDVASQLSRVKGERKDSEGVQVTESVMYFDPQRSTIQTLFARVFICERVLALTFQT